MNLSIRVIKESLAQKRQRADDDEQTFRRGRVGGQCGQVTVVEFLVPRFSYAFLTHTNNIETMMRHDESSLAGNF